MFPHYRSLARIGFPVTIALALSTFSFSFLDAEQPNTRTTPAAVDTLPATLNAHLPGQAGLEIDLGEAPSSLRISGVRLVLSRTPAQDAELVRLLDDLQNPASPSFHRWLSPQEFGKRFGPSDAELDDVASWLTRAGLTVDSISPGRTNLTISGTVANMESTFHTNIRAFSTNGRHFYSTVSEPIVPSPINRLISGIANLDTLATDNDELDLIPGSYDAASQRFVARSDLRRNGESGSPAITRTQSYGDLYLVPADAATIYDAPNPVYNPSYSTTAPVYTGAGVSIGVISNLALDPTAVQSYRNLFLGSNYNTLPTIVTVGTPPTAASGEAYVEAEISGGIAPGAKIYYYTSTSITAAIEQALSDNIIDILNFSFYNCEANISASGNSQILGWWQQAAAQGIAVVVSSGDTGTAGCDPIANSSGVRVEEASNGMAINGWASPVYDIAVGGSDFYPLANATTFGNYINSSNSASNYYRSALSYIPESTWNPSTQVDLTLSQNIPWFASNDTQLADILAGGGGPSSCWTTSNGACGSGYPKPVWQRGTGVPQDGVRDIPDVALMSGSGTDNAIWLACTNGQYNVSSSLTVTTNCTTQADNNFYFVGIGGTRASAPLFSGILALVQQKTGSRLGQAAVPLYNLFNSAAGGSVFHDITLGNNSVPCSLSASPNGCATNTANYSFMTGFNAGPGYDLATGLGSVDITGLISNWQNAIGTGSTTVTVSPSATSVPVANPLMVLVTVSSSTGTPTGTVTLYGGGFTAAAQTLSNGSATFTIPGGSLSAGSDILTATYNGSATESSSTGTATVTVVPPPASFTLSATPVVVTAGKSATTTITVTPVNGYSGAITLTAQVTASPSGSIAAPTFTPSLISIGSGATAPVSGLLLVLTTGAASTPASVRTLTSGASGWFLGAGILALLPAIPIYFARRKSRWIQLVCLALITVSVALLQIGCSGSTALTQSSPSTPILQITPASSSIAANGSLSVGISVSGTQGQTPTGTIFLNGGSYSSPSTSLASGSATVVIPPNSFNPGTNWISATYSGDQHYSPVAGSASVSVTTPPTTPGTYTITVTGTGNDAASTTATTTFTLTVD